MEAAEFLHAFEAQGGFGLLSGDQLRAMDRLLRCDDMFLMRLVAGRAAVPEELDTPALSSLQQFFKTSAASGLRLDGRTTPGEARRPTSPLRSPGIPSGGAAVRRFGGSAVFRGPVQDHIETKLSAALKPVHLEVHNESHGHVTDESHFHVVAVSTAFEGLRPLQRHRLINGLFTKEDGDLKFHSLRITAKTPSQWAASEVVPPAPKCSGKGDGRTPTDASQL
jgi:BolA protein